jgi:hypothetical protein
MKITKDFLRTVIRESLEGMGAVEEASLDEASGGMYVVGVENVDGGGIFFGKGLTITYYGGNQLKSAIKECKAKRKAISDADATYLSPVVYKLEQVYRAPMLDMDKPKKVSKPNIASPEGTE